MNVRRTRIIIFLMFGMFFSGTTAIIFLSFGFWQAFVIIKNATTITVGQFGWPIIDLFCFGQMAKLFFDLLDEWTQKRRDKMI
ncbi:hypothetical protein JW977_03605 [Candidatus Falkowbacteria bacterium]|nr:hypothetical protein [Candidatus Falkowbacteria bacterium]